MIILNKEQISLKIQYIIPEYNNGESLDNSNRLNEHVWRIVSIKE